MRARAIETKAKPFSGFPTGRHKFLVEDGTVRVYDSVAGYYTTCHSLSPVSQRRIRRLAAQESRP